MQPSLVKGQQDQQVISTIRAGHIPLVYGNPEAILSASWRSVLDNACFYNLDCCCSYPFARIYIPVSVYIYYNYIILFS